MTIPLEIDYHTSLIILQIKINWRAIDACVQYYVMLPAALCFRSFQVH